MPFSFRRSQYFIINDTYSYMFENMDYQQYRPEIKWRSNIDRNIFFIFKDGSTKGQQ